MRRTRATDEDGQTNGKQKKQAVKRRKRKEYKKNPSSSPLHFCHTEVELMLMMGPIRFGFLGLRWSRHGDQGCNMKGCIWRRFSEEQPLFRVFAGDGSRTIALDVLREVANRRGIMRIYE